MAETGFNITVKKDAGTKDTLALIVHTVNAYAHSRFAKEAAALLCPPGTDHHTCMRNVFDAYCRNISYKLDTPEIENIWTPQLTTLMGTGDCKKAATWIASVLKAAGIEPVLKHVHYSGDTPWTHIYVIVPDPDINNYITLDPTDGCRYNREVKYRKGTLYFLNGKVMDLHMMGNPNSSVDTFSSVDELISGIEEIGENFMSAPGMPAALKHHVSAVNALTKNHPHLKSKLITVPIENQRGAFLHLIKNNVGGLASGLAKALGTDPKALDKVWQQIGGDMATLKKEVIAAASKPVTPLTGIHGGEYIGKFSLKGIFHAAAGVLHTVAAVASFIPVVGPIVGSVVNKVADVADKASATTPDINLKDKAAINAYVATLPTDSSGTKTLPAFNAATDMHGSFFSPVGFVFKSLLLISLLHLSPEVSGIIGDIVVGSVVLIVLTNKFLKNV